MTPARAFLALAGWFAAGMSFGVGWLLVTGGAPPWWATAAVGAVTFAAVEVGGRTRARRRGSR